jgi:hypothetical protein
MAVLLETKNQEDGRGGAGDRSTHGRSISNGGGTTDPRTSSKRANRQRFQVPQRSCCRGGEERCSPDRDVDEAMTTLFEGDEMVRWRWTHESGMVVKMTRRMISSRPTA